MQSVQHNEYKWRQGLQNFLTTARSCSSLPATDDGAPRRIESPRSSSQHWNRCWTFSAADRSVPALNIDHLCKKAFHVSSDDPLEILGLSICGAFCLVAAGAPDHSGLRERTFTCILGTHHDLVVVEGLLEAY